MVPKSGRERHGKGTRRKAVPLSQAEYERLMQRPPDVEDALEFEEALQEELGEDAVVEMEPPEGLD